MSLFYIAFYLRDIPLLQWVSKIHFPNYLCRLFYTSIIFILLLQQVALMLLVFQVINQFTETLWPYLNRRYVLSKVRWSTGLPCNCLVF